MDETTSDQVKPSSEAPIKKAFLTSVLVAAFALHPPLTAQTRATPPSDMSLVVHGLNDKTLWETTMFLALQGIANRKRPGVYMFLNGKNDRIWLDWYKKEYQLKTKSLDDPY